MFVYSGDPISQSKLKIYPNNILPTKKEKVHHRRQQSRSTTMQSGHHHHGHPKVLPVFHALENIPTISTETRGYFPQGPNFVFLNFVVANQSKSHILQPQALPNFIADSLLVLIFPFPPNFRSLYIRRTLIVRLCQHTHHGDQNLLNALNG